MKKVPVDAATGNADADRSNSLSEIAPPLQKKPGKFGEFLVRNGYITAEQLQQALRIQQDRFRSLIDVMLELGMVSHEDLVQLEQELKDTPWANEPEIIFSGGP